MSKHKDEVVAEPTPPTNEEVAETMYNAYADAVQTAGALQCATWSGLHENHKAGWRAAALAGKALGTK